MIGAKISDLHALNIHYLQAVSCDFIMTQEKVHEEKLNVIARVNNDAVGKLDLKLKDHIFVLFGGDEVYSIIESNAIILAKPN